MCDPYEFTIIDAGQPVLKIFKELQKHISRLKLVRPMAHRTPAKRPASKKAIA
jgi:hypothetical protein